MKRRIEIGKRKEVMGEREKGKNIER